MGADDEEIEFDKKEDYKKKIREQYCINEKDFLIVTGGKIDESKGTHILMDAVSKMKNVKLLIFGSPIKEYEKTFYSLINSNCRYIGWIDSKDVYIYFLSADLIVFPGQHSVLWEQACATKVPCVFKYYEGMDHINNGGNSIIIQFENDEELKKELKTIINSDLYNQLKKISESEATDIYLYSKIADKSVECITDNKMQNEYKQHNIHSAI